jgi:predicted acyl esterase
MKQFFLLIAAAFISIAAFSQNQQPWANNGKLDAFEEFTTKYTLPMQLPDGVRLYTDMYLPRLRDSLVQPLDIETTIPFVGLVKAKGMPTFIEKGEQIIFYDSINGQPNPNPYQMPTIFTRTPYNKGGVDETDAVGSILAILGYNYCLQDMRGRYQSEGVYFPMYSDSWNKNAYHPNWAHVLDYTDFTDPKNSNKHEDGYESVKIIARMDSAYFANLGFPELAKQLYEGYPHTNTKVNNGSIGMFGASALGNTQLQLALAHRITDSIPELKCLMPIVATTEHYISTGYNNGVFRDRIVTGWLKGQIFTGTDDDAIPTDLDRQNNIHSSADYDLPKKFEVNGVIRQYNQNKFDAANICIDHFSAKRYPKYPTNEQDLAGFYPGSVGRADMDGSVAFVDEFGESVQKLGNGVEIPRPNLTHSRYTNLRTAVMHVTGWWDIFTEGQINTHNYTVKALKETGQYQYAKMQKSIIGPWAHQTVGSRSSGDRRIDPVTGRDSRYPENVTDVTKVDLGDVSLTNVPLDQIIQSDLITWFRYNLNYNGNEKLGEPKFIIRAGKRWQKLDSLFIFGKWDTIREVRLPAKDVIIPFGQMINFLAGSDSLDGITIEIKTEKGIINAPIPAIKPTGALLPALANNKVKGIPKVNFLDSIPAFRLYLAGPDYQADAEKGFDNTGVGNYWLGLEEFPPATGVEWKKMYLHQNGTIDNNQPTTNEGFRTYIHDPDDPILTCGGNNMIVRSPDGSRNSQSQMDAASPENAAYTMNREGVISFSSAPLTDTFSILGFPVCTLYAKTNPGGVLNGPTDTDWFVRLFDEFPDGRVMFVQEGCVNARARDWARALVDKMTIDPSHPSYFNGIEDPDDRFIPYTNINIGEIYEYVFKFQPIGYTFGKGHKLRVLISSSNYTRYQVNPNLPLNDGEFFRRKPGDGQSYKFNGVDMTARVAVQRIAFAPDNATSIVFPVWNSKNYVGVKEITEKIAPFDVNVFPNPAADFVQLFVNKFGTYQLQITDVAGKAVHSSSFEDNAYVDLSKFNSGIYFARITDAANPANAVVKKFTVN